MEATEGVFALAAGRFAGAEREQRAAIEACRPLPDLPLRARLAVDLLQREPAPGDLQRSAQPRLGVAEPGGGGVHVGAGVIAEHFDADRVAVIGHGSSPVAMGGVQYSRRP